MRNHTARFLRVWALVLMIHCFVAAALAIGISLRFGAAYVSWVVWVVAPIPVELPLLAVLFDRLRPPPSDAG